MSTPAAQLRLWDDYRFEWSSQERRLCRRHPRQTVTEWAESHVKLPPEVTSLPGYYRASHTPYLREVVDTAGQRHVRRVVFCAGPQTGKTLSAYLPLLHAMARAPGPALLVMSGEDGARKVVRDYITPILRESPELRALLPSNPDDVTARRIYLANGMRIYAAWATSPQLLKTFPARYGIGDEVDDWPMSAGERGGDPEALFDVRLRTYPHNSKLTLVSSPVDETRGVWKKLLECQELRVYLCRCPQCGAEQRMTWPERADPEHRRWLFDSSLDPAELEGGRSVAYACARCGTHWDDAERDRAVKSGRWQPVRREYLADPERWHDPFPEAPDRVAAEPMSVGFHLPAWCSRMVSLSKVAGEFLRAHRETDPAIRRERLKAWRNNYPALPWRDEPAAPVEISAILAMRDDRPAGLVPIEAICLTAGIDTQDDGFWFEIRAWGYELTSWLVAYGFVLDWESLARVLVEARYETAEGVAHAVQYALQDSGGHRAAEVYEFCRRSAVIRPSKGEQKLSSPVLWSRIDTYPGTAKKIPGGLQLARLNTTFFKDGLSSRLKVAPGDPGAWHLHADTREDYARQVTAEYRDETTGVWQVRGGQPNHLWDCAVLNLACAEVLQLRAARPAAPRPSRPQGAPGGGANALSGRKLNPGSRG